MSPAERVVCSAVVDDLHRGLDRYPPYREQVNAAPNPAYVTVAGSDMDLNMVRRIDREGLQMNDIATAGRYRVYLPIGKVKPYEYE